MSSPITQPTGAAPRSVLGIVWPIVLAVVSAFGIVGTIIFGPTGGRPTISGRTSGQMPGAGQGGQGRGQGNMPSDMPTSGTGGFPGNPGGPVTRSGGMGMAPALSTWNIVVIVIFALILVGSVVALIMALRSRPATQAAVAMVPGQVGVAPVVMMPGQPGVAPAAPQPVVQQPVVQPVVPQPEAQPPVNPATPAEGKAD